MSLLLPGVCGAAAHADWQEERKELKRFVQSLQAEISLLRVERDTFEKEATRVTLHTGLTFVDSAAAPPDDTPEVVGLFNNFMLLDRQLRGRITELSTGTATKDDLRNLKNGCDQHQRDVSKGPAKKEGTCARCKQGPSKEGGDMCVM